MGQNTVLLSLYCLELNIRQNQSEIVQMKMIIHSIEYINQKLYKKDSLTDSEKYNLRTLIVQLGWVLDQTTPDVAFKLISSVVLPITTKWWSC